MPEPAKNESISKNGEKDKQSDQPRDVVKDNTEQDDATFDPGTPFPESGVHPN